MTKRLRNNNRGFTLVEMLIATTVFSIMLLIVSAVVVSLSRQFYKGIAKARTQEVARTITEELINNLQFSTADPVDLVPDDTAAVQGIQIADRCYWYRNHRQIGNGANQSAGVLVRDSTCAATLGDPLPAANPTNGQAELIGERMRLANLEINSDDSGKLWHVKVRVVLGEDDLVCNPADASDPTDTCAPGVANSTTDLQSADLTCRSEAGSQFCAVSEYEATVVKRL